jgi:hypothetical protein
MNRARGAALALAAGLAALGCGGGPGGGQPGPPAGDAGTDRRDGPGASDGPGGAGGGGSGGASAADSGGSDGGAGGTAADAGTADSPPASDSGSDGTSSADGAAGIVVENLEPGETVPHDLVVLQGRLEGPGDRLTVDLGGRSTEWPVAGGRFRALALLAQGPNQVRLRAGERTLDVSLVYQPPTNPRFIRFVYIVAADGDGSFGGPDGQPLPQQAALDRMRVDARLMQTFTAETMKRAGLGRRTFRLARDAAHEPVVEVFKTKMTNAQARGMDGNALWSAFYTELGALPDRSNSLDVAVMSMSQYQPAMKSTLAHTALGGGRLGLFGSTTLYAHAASLEEVPQKFGDATLVDTTRVPDDSAGRGSLWANYATGLGATQHEMGHCLSLPHPANRQGFMARAFDHFNRTFAITEPRSRTGTGLSPTLPTSEAGLDRSNAVRLRFHRWLAPTAVTYQVNQPPTFTVDNAGVRIASAAGVRHVQYLVNGEGADHDEHLTDPPPPSVMLTLDRLRTRFPAATSVNISTIDNDGNIATRNDVILR